MPVAENDESDPNDDNEILNGLDENVKIEGNISLSRFN